jgi:hypothetical protein
MGDRTTLTISSDMPFIQPNASDRYTLEKITIENGVTIIDYMAFMSCKNLRTITIPDSVKKISSYAFQGCCRLTRIVIPDIELFGYDLFKNCVNLADVVIKTSRINTKYSIFVGCRRIVRVWTNSAVVFDDYTPFVVVGPGIPTLALLRKWTFAVHWHWLYPTRMTRTQQRLFTLGFYFLSLPPELTELVFTYIGRHTTCDAPCG